MTRTEIKQAAQDALMSAAQTAFSDPDIDDAVRAELDRQFERMEVLFKYERGSWARSS